MKYILEEHLSILDILNHFPSCKPDVGILIGLIKNLLLFSFDNYFLL